jgi:outer membrane protein, heavy metal efflux system
MALPQPDAFETLLQRIEQSPDLMRFMSEQRMQEANLQLEMAQRSLPWRFNAGIRRIEGSSDTALVAGVTVPLDRGNRNQGRIEEVRIALEQTAAERDARHLQLRTALHVFYQELQHSLHRAELLEQTVIPRYREAMNHIRQAYESGAASYTEWIQVQDELLSARMELLETSVMAHLNLIEIERLTGLPVQRTPSNQSNPLP